MQNDDAKEYLKINDFGFDFSFKSNNLFLDEQANQIVELYKQKCNLIIYNNEIAFSALPKEIKISKVKIDNQQNVFHSYSNGNYNNENAYFNFEIEASTPKSIFILYVFNGDCTHCSLIKTNENSSLNCLEKFVLLNNGKVNFVRQLELDENSKIQLTNLEEMNTLNFIHRLNANVFENANLTYSCVNLNEGKALNYQNIILKEKNAVAVVKSAVFANKNDYLPCLTQITHSGKSTTSLIKNFAFVNDSSKVDIEGVNIILKGKSKSNARQETKIYNLTKDAKSVANPQLIIDEVDVKASHACAIGSIDEGAIYYLMSRGIERNKAKEMIILGMVDDILIDITNSEEQNSVINKIINKIKE